MRSRTSMMAVLAVSARRSIETRRMTEEYLDGLVSYPGYLQAPPNVAGVLSGSNTVVPTWRDESEDETGFRVERAVVDSFQTVATLPANATTVGAVWAFTTRTTANQEPSIVWAFDIVTWKDVARSVTLPIPSG